MISLLNVDLRLYNMLKEIQSDKHLLSLCHFTGKNEMLNSLQVQAINNPKC